MEIKKTTYKDQVIEYIYKEILKGYIKPNDQVKESQLSEALQISRAPIREALKELVSMGLLSYKPRIGTFVIDMQPGDIYDSYVTRGILEGYAVAHSFAKLSLKDMENLIDMCEQMEILALNRKNVKLIDLGDKFHKNIFKTCNNRQLVHFINMLNLKSHLLFSAYWPKLYTPVQIKNRHMVIINAINQKNASNIEKTIRHHYEETGKKIASLKEKEIKNGRKYQNL